MKPRTRSAPPRAMAMLESLRGLGYSTGAALADIIDVTKLSGSTIKFGATVKLVDEDTEAEKYYQIVGDAEADLSKGRISISSPIARAMIGKEAGDSVEVAAPGGAKTYEILDVKFV